MAQPLTAPYCQFIDANGVPLSGGKVYTYAAGTTTPQATYTDSAAGTPNANPVILDSAGRASIWLSSSSYKIVVKDSSDTTIHTDDNISIASGSSSFADNVFTISNSSDATKKAMVDASAIASATTRTYAFPNKSGTFAMTSDIVTSVVTVKSQQFTASGTYTPSTGMLYCIAEAWGGGGAGGGAPASAGACGGGGGAGSYSKKTLSAATVGVSQVITIGAGGTAGSGTGGNGADTSVGSLCVGKGGNGGVVGAGSTRVLGGVGGVAGTGDVTTVGTHGGYGDGLTASGQFSGAGGITSLMGSGWSQYYTAEAVGISATANSGSGGGGAASNGTAHNGGAGGSGYIVITEFCSQ